MHEAVFEVQRHTILPDRLGYTVFSVSWEIASARCLHGK
jgi:hypothetical protein